MATAFTVTVEALVFAFASAEVSTEVVTKITAYCAPAPAAARECSRAA
ncbi:MAG: hypothetical protein LBJ86_03985 [Spirochaetaceae bacterium]|nr:hypothetical protein [Spirochaetaceae bacterium]